MVFVHLGQLLESVITEFPNESVSFRDLIHEPWRDSPQGRELIVGVDDANEFGIFDDMRLHGLGNSSFAHSRAQLVSWMVRASRELGPRAVLKGVEKYLNSSSFQAYQVMLLSGPMVGGAFEFEHGIHLQPVTSVPVKWIANLGSPSLTMQYPVPRSFSALVRPLDHPRIVRRQNEETEYHDVGNGSDLDRVRLALTMATQFGAGVQVIGWTVAAADDIPLEYAGWHFSSSVSNPFPYTLTDMQIDTAREFDRRFNLADEQTRNALAVPLDRLNNSASTSDPTRKVIDLRTAIEGLFLPARNEAELGFRAALNAALYLGSTQGEREEIFAAIKHTYAQGSKAIHGGKVSTKYDGNSVKRAAKAVREGIIKRVGAPKPDWQEIALSSRS